MEDVGEKQERPRPLSPESMISTISKDVERGPDSLEKNIDDASVSAEATEPNALTRTLSRVRTKDSGVDPGPPPDRGVKAWGHAVLVHLVIFNTWGYINSFGLFQSYYVNQLHQQPSAVSWIGSVQIFLTFFIGTFSGRATDGGYFKLTFIIGSVIQLVGIFMTSLCTKYWQIFLSQGVCTGIGNGLVFVPSVSLLSTYFLKNRSLALGFAASGSATGGLVFPAIAETLLPSAGFGWTVRTMGFVMMAVMVVCAVLMKPRLPPRKSGPLVEWNAFLEGPYFLFALTAFLLFWAVYFAYYYVPSFGRDIIHLSQSDSINLLLTMNGVGIIGRMVPNYIADRVGPLNVFVPVAIINSAMLYCWTAVDSSSGLWAFTVVYGIFGASIQGLFPAALSSLTEDPKKMGTRMGMTFSVVGFAVLTGPPIGGALIQKDNGGFLYAQVFAGTSMALGFVTIVCARIAKAGRKFRVKV
ncbi:MAG: hypothetical protein Q9227_006856 [Pyrenula ochraceoflavens]